jgi:hypothetical protein
MDSLAKHGPRFLSETRIDEVVRGDWVQLAQNDILFLPKETARGEGDTLIDVDNVVRFGLAFWESLEPELIKL